MERRCARGVGSVSGRRERSLGCEHMFDGGSAMDEPRREQAAVLALVRASPGEWYQTADVIAEAGSAPGGGRAGPAGLAGGRAAAGVPVLSGLARGLDTAAPAAALDARGRTVAVVGTGILARVYPPENGELARRIVAEGGAVVSQFWPQAPPQKANFPTPTVVMS